ncbi:MAG: RNA polymerase sigma factor [Pseudomonadota bacterium]
MPVPADPMNVDEAGLIQGLINREDAAFRTAIRAFQPAMFQVARGIAGTAIADEVVQESWFSIMRALPGFAGRSSLKTWVLRIVANEAKTRLRKENRSESLEALAHQDPEFGARFDGNGHWLTGRVPADWGAHSPEDLLASEELADCMQRVIGNLPDLQEATLRLREQHGFSPAEICNILDVSESNVRVLLHRARTRLFGAINHFQDTGECQADTPC